MISIDQSEASIHSIYLNQLQEVNIALHQLVFVLVCRTEDAYRFGHITRELCVHGDNGIFLDKMTDFPKLMSEIVSPDLPYFRQAVLALCCRRRFVAVGTLTIRLTQLQFSFITARGVILANTYLVEKMKLKKILDLLLYFCSYHHHSPLDHCLFIKCF